MPKQQRILSFLGDWLLLFCGSTGAVLCVLSAYSIPFHCGLVVCIALLISLYWCLVFSLGKRGVWLLLVGCFVGIIYLAAAGESVIASARLCISTLQQYFAQTMSFIPAANEAYLYPQNATVTPFVALVLALLNLSMAWSLSTGEGSWLAVALPLPFLALSIVYMDMPPALVWVAMLLVYLGGVLFTAGLRNQAPHKRGAVTLSVFAVLVLAALLWSALIPKDDFDAQEARPWQQKAQDIFEDLKRFLDKGVKSSEELMTQGKRMPSGHKVMELQTDKDGLLYLRGYSLSVYNGSKWESGPAYTGELGGLTLLGISAGEPNAYVSIQAEKQGLLYTPYAFIKGEDGELGEGYIRSKGIERYGFAYSFDWIEDISTRHRFVGEEEYAAWVQDSYTKLDGELKDKLKSYLYNHGLERGEDNYQTAIRVAEHVKNAALYDLNPGKTPGGQDFVLYFLQGNRKGYCVHFASAAAVLLQAMDIPARYVVGYVCMAEANSLMELTDENAHAWVEVYCPGLGWVMVEPTGIGPDGIPGQREAQTQPSHSPEPTVEPTAEPTQEPTSEPDGTPVTEPDLEPTLEPTQEVAEPGSTEPAPTADVAAMQYTPGPTELQEPSVAPATPGEKEGEKSFLWWLLLLPLAFILYLFYRRRVIQQYNRLLHQKDGNKALLYMYHRLKGLYTLGASMPKEAEALAQKAYFSQHIISKEERDAMEMYLKAAQKHLDRTLPPFKRFIHKQLLCKW